MPKSVYQVYHVGQKGQRGSAAMRSKDRVTIVVACNATGTKLVPLAMIGKSANPRCFSKKESSPIKYYNQSSAWMDKALCTKWLLDVFVPYVRVNNKGRQVALLWDGLKAHNISDAASTLETCNITVILIPPNTTSHFQPLDQGIISVLKQRYRTLLINKYIDKIDNLQQLRTDGSAKTAGTAGLEFAMDPHLRDVATLLKSVWDQFNPQAVINCFVKSKILPANHNEILRGMSRKECDLSKSELKTKRVEDVQVGKLIVKLDQLDLGHSGIYEEVDQWFDIDDDPVMLIEFCEGLSMAMDDHMSDDSDAPVQVPIATNPVTPTPASTILLQSPLTPQETPATVAPATGPSSSPAPPVPMSTPAPDVSSRLLELKQLFVNGLLPESVYNSSCVSVLKEFGLVHD